jgi:hypothetical protein
MRDEWYGDKRDLIKWGVLLDLEQRYKAKQILQVLYYRPGEWKPMEIDGDKVELILRLFGIFAIHLLFRRLHASPA